MYLKKDIKNLLPISNLDNLYVVADFDRTITNGSSKTSWSILANSDLVPSSYVQERQALYEKYRPIEIDETMDLNLKISLVKEWFQKHIELLVKYQISESIFEKAATDLRIMEFRPGAKEFITFLAQNQIPLIIISAGIGNFIETFLKRNNCFFENIYISSNQIIFENGIAVGVGENIIHSLNKNEVSLPFFILEKLKNRNQVLLLGDQVNDLRMVDKTKHKNLITVGFVADDAENKQRDLEENFDIVFEKEEDYFKLKKLLFNKE